MYMNNEPGGNVIMKKKSKLTKVMSLVMTLALVLSLVPITAMATEEQAVDLTDPAEVQEQEDASGEGIGDLSDGEEEEPAGSEESEESEELEEVALDELEEDGEIVTLDAEVTTADVYDYYNSYSVRGYEAPDSSDFYKVVHVDCGRKYFSAANIKQLIDNAAAAGFNQVELYLSDNQGFRFALNDMTVTTFNGTEYDLSDALGDGYSDGSKYPDGSGKYLTQSEMTSIISYAENKGVEIVPCINTPGHMGAILEEFTDFRYSGSKSSIDLENGEAVAFALAIVEKYAAYFAAQGVKHFNIGADEYANDLSSMGFQGLYTSGKYQKFVDYLNAAARIVKSYNMTPWAFNDGIYYNNDTSYEIDQDIQVCYWSSGWSGYNVASAATINSQGHRLINTHGDYYWVLGNSSWQCSATKASGFDYTSFQGGTISDPAGAMFCIWCDVGNADGTDGGSAVVSATADVIAAFGAALPQTETSSEVTLTEDAVTVTALDLTKLTVTSVTSGVPGVVGISQWVAYDITPATADGSYAGTAKVTIQLSDWTVKNKSDVKVYVVENNALKLVEDSSYSASAKSVTFTAPHFSTYVVTNEASDEIEVTENKDITVTVGKTATATISGANYSNNVDRTELDTSKATVTVTGTDGSNATVVYTKVASNPNWNTLIFSNTTSVTSYYYLASDGNYYQLYVTRSKGTQSNRYNYSLGYYANGSSTLTSVASATNSRGNSAISNVTLYTQSGTEATPASTTVTFTGVAEGTTYVTVGNTRYTINVLGEDLSGITLTVEYWITNMQVTADGATSKAISAQSAYGEAGVDISTLVPATGTYAYGSVVYWKGTVLDSSNKQTTASGSENDKTGSGEDFTQIRYYGGSWQYLNSEGVWTTINDSDQVVIYWLQPTEVTKEITTLVKDWGYAPSNQQGDNNNKVALTVAVVYPDGTVSPAEDDMYSTSTTLFNYWSGRDIGLVAPVNNSDYEISKITVTDGTRDQSGTGQWGASDTITWDKVTNEAGEQWYNETTYWDETVGGTPMVNGVTSNITWSTYNTAKLVLIYLKPVHYDTNLIVNWVDDSASGALISTMEVAVSSDGTPITFYNGLKQTSALPTEGVGGTFTLDDDAYVTNSSNVNQTFNKNISTVPGVADQYKSGLYQYVSAELSADGMTLTLHYNINSSKLAKTYVLDFGLPVRVPISDLVANEVSNITSTSSKISYTAGDSAFVYTPSGVMTGTDTVKITVTFTNGTSQTFSIGFAPATTVYYEEGFATFSGFSGGSRGSGYQTAEVAGEKTNNYGYDDAYSATGASNGTKAESTAYGSTATFTFTGTGVEVYANSTADSGRISVQVKNSSGSTVKLLMVETKMQNGTTDATSGQSVNAYNVPVARITGLDYGKYTVTITHIKSSTEASASTVSLDGFRVFNTLNSEPEFYTTDEEDNPTFIELRDQVLASVNVTAEESSYAKQIAGNTLAQVFASAGVDSTVAGAAILTSSNAEYTDAQLKDLLDNGPKNEIYLMGGQSLVFTVSTNRVVQVGLKALNESTSCTINGVSKTISSSTDMFYTVAGKGSDGRELSVTITNTGSNILAVTLLKVCDDPNATLGTLTEENITAALVSLGYAEEETPAEPEKPSKPEKPAKPSKPSKPSKPTQPAKPGNGTQKPLPGKGNAFGRG